MFDTIALWLLSSTHDPGIEQPQTVLIRGQLARLLRFGPFQRIYLFQTATAFADGLTGSFLNILYLKYLGMSFFLINAFVAASKGSKGALAFVNRWLQKRHEPLPLFQVSVAITSLAPLLLLGANPGSAFLLAASLIVAETARGIMSPAEQTLMMRWSTAGDQTGDFTLNLLQPQRGGCVHAATHSHGPAHRIRARHPGRHKRSAPHPSAHHRRRRAEDRGVAAHAATRRRLGS